MFTIFIFALFAVVSTAWSGDKDLTRAPQSAGPAHPRRDVALVIGVEAYRNVPPLDYAIDDAQAVASALIESGGFRPDDVVTMTSSDTNDPLSPTRTHILEQLAALRSRDDVRLLLIYFSGHGGAGQVGASKENYLFPLDVSPAVLEQTGVPMTEVLRLADDVPATARLVLVDACRDKGTRSLGSRAGMVNPGRAYDLTGTITVFGTAWDRVAGEQTDLRHGLFTYYLVEGLRGDADGTLPGTPADGQISLEEAYTYTRARLQDFATKKGVEPQRPVREGRETEGSDLLIVPVPGVVHARCPNASAEELDDAQQDALRLCDAQEPERFIAAARVARETLGCLVNPLTPDQDVLDHQIAALYASMVHDDALAALEWRAATWTAQKGEVQLELPPACALPEQTRAAATAMAPATTDTPAAPKDGQVRVGGLRSPKMLSAGPSNVQVVWGYGVAEPPVRWDGLGPPPVLSDRVRPYIARDRERAARLAVGAGASLVAASGLWAGSYVSNQRYQAWGRCVAGTGDDCPGGLPTDPGDQASEERRMLITTDALAAGAVLASGAAVGLGAVSIQIAF